MELGKQIKKHRQEARLSQKELANRIYVSRQTISNWENDKSYPDVNSLVLLSEIFQTSLDKLIKGDVDSSAIYVAWFLGVHTVGDYFCDIHVFCTKD